MSNTAAPSAENSDLAVSRLGTEGFFADDLGRIPGTPLLPRQNSSVDTNRGQSNTPPRTPISGSVSPSDIKPETVPAVGGLQPETVPAVGGPQPHANGASEQVTSAVLETEPRHLRIGLHIGVMTLLTFGCIFAGVGAFMLPIPGHMEVTIAGAVLLIVGLSTIITALVSTFTCCKPTAAPDYILKMLTGQIYVVAVEDEKKEKKKKKMKKKELVIVAGTHEFEQPKRPLLSAGSSRGSTISTPAPASPSATSLGRFHNNAEDENTVSQDIPMEERVSPSSASPAGAETDILAESNT